MTDTQIKGVGNSRYLRTIPNALEVYATYEDFMAALIQGQFPIDFAGINPQGIVTQGTKLNKSTLLTDTVANALGLTGDKTPTQAFDKLRQLVNTAQSTADSNKGRLKALTGTYVGTGIDGRDITFLFNGTPKVLVVNIQGEATYQRDFAMAFYPSEYGVYGAKRGSSSSAALERDTSLSFSWLNGKVILKNTDNYSFNIRDVTYDYFIMGD